MGSGLVAVYARPGRNLTGMGGFAAGLYVKQLQLLKEVVPKASRIAMFINDDFPLHAASRSEIEPAARRLGVTLIPVQVRVPEDIDIAFATIARDKIDALYILGQPLIGAQRERVATLALDRRMPAISPFDIATEAGLLFSGASNLWRAALKIPSTCLRRRATAAAL